MTAPTVCGFRPLDRSPIGLGQSHGFRFCIDNPEKNPRNFVLLLGHPTYSLTVIIFSMLVIVYRPRRIADGEDFIDAGQGAQQPRQRRMAEHRHAPRAGRLEQRHGIDREQRQAKGGRRPHQAISQLGQMRAQIWPASFAS